MDNSIFYTFSTVAQVVAGVGAIITALCIFRLQSLEFELRQRVDQINADESVDTSELSEKVCAEHHIVRRTLGVRLKQIKVIDPSGAAYNFLRLKWMILAISYGQMLVIFTLGLSISMIVFSVAVLSMVDHSMALIIPDVFASKSELLWFGVGACAFTLFFNALTLVRIFRNR